MDVYYAGGFILGAFVWALCAYYCYQVAPRFHRRARNWGILGIFFGPIALMVLYVLPKGNVVEEKGRGAVPGKPGTKSQKEQQQAALYEKPHKK